MKQHSVKNLTIASMLIAMGILIPMVMPKIIIGPASFTLASHVPIMIAMFFSPMMAIAVALGTTFGFFLTTPFIIAMRALSHVLFVTIGALYLRRHPEIVLSKRKFFVFNLLIGLIHTIAEVLVVALFFATGQATGAKIEMNFYTFLFGFMGVGGFIHSLVDFTLAFYVVQTCSRLFQIPVFQKARTLTKKVKTIEG